VIVPNPSSKAKKPVDYDLTCWYLNHRRVLELVGIEAVAATATKSTLTPISFLI
jgi:hypothetical protein